jgi:hypothetical protein
VFVLIQNFPSISALPLVNDHVFTIFLTGSLYFSELTMFEMKSGWDSEKDQIVKALTTKLQTEKELAIKEAKKKQWVNCSYSCAYMSGYL